MTVATKQTPARFAMAGTMLRQLHTFAGNTLALQTLGVTLLGVAAAFCVPASLEFHRQAIFNGELWRIFTGHLAHWTPGHAFWDIVTFIALGSLALRAGGPKWWATVGGSAALISVAVLVALPTMEHYRGLSGIDCALLGLAAGTWGVEALRHRDWGKGLLAIGLVAGFVIKACVEIHTGIAPFAGDMGAGVVSVPLAHLVGVGLGLLVAAGPMAAAPMFRALKPTSSHRPTK